MFGMGFFEIVFIAIIAVLFLGPEKLPQAMIDIARFLKKIKSTIADTREELEKELQISDLKAEMLSYKSQLDEMTHEVRGVTGKNILKDEIDDIKSTIKDVSKLPQTLKNDFEKQETTHEKAEPKREVVTFTKKKTPIVKNDDDTEQA